MIPLSDDNPTRRTPVVTVSAIVSCLLAYGYQALHAFSTGRSLSSSCGFIPYEFLTGTDIGPMACVAPIQLTVVTSMFLHGGLVHLGGNMLYLWIFGNNVEAVLGSMRYAVFYVVCGVLAAVGQAGVTLVIWPEDIGVPMIGASGAVAGVLGANLVRFPSARVRTLLTLGFFWSTVRLPAWFVLGAWFALQFAQAVLGFASDDAGGVATWAHVVGFIAGAILVRLVAPPRRKPAW
jgi:membrane associated rhomboid family serine protease